eukprot:CAMPEP_0115120900 /NCGR_PEP_ID=MMETSP0227-20121206/45951_1 /TAXON_ID=89957 /ORGANISM="Polarella glacialis, Strain CCMP 1383" /LENGTH=511 /DNA_ID=CAMNT_0002522627 /DNA_START=39 /DNA_END=1574 /DNA_ORIENTATION=+
MASRAVRKGALTDSLWGASFFEELVALATSATSSSSSNKADKKLKKKAQQKADDVLEIVSQFCQEYPAARVQPTAEELTTLLSRCAPFRPTHVAAAFTEQLSLRDGIMEWQPRFRALCALELCVEEGQVPGSAPRGVANLVREESGALLEYLASDVPQCAAKARRVLAAASLTGSKKLLVAPFASTEKEQQQQQQLQQQQASEQQQQRRQQQQPQPSKQQPLPSEQQRSVEKEASLPEQPTSESASAVGALGALAESEPKVPPGSPLPLAEAEDDVETTASSGIAGESDDNCGAHDIVAEESPAGVVLSIELGRPPATVETSSAAIQDFDLDEEVQKELDRRNWEELGLSTLSSSTASSSAPVVPTPAVPESLAFDPSAPVAVHVQGELEYVSAPAGWAVDFASGEVAEDGWAAFAWPEPLPGLQEATSPQTLPPGATQELPLPAAEAQQPAQQQPAQQQPAQKQQTGKGEQQGLKYLWLADVNSAMHEREVWRDPLAGLGHIQGTAAEGL